MKDCSPRYCETKKKSVTVTDSCMNQMNLRNAECFHSLNLDLGIQICLVSIIDEFKPNGHKKMRYLKGTQFSAIEIKLSSLFRARYSSVASYSKLPTPNYSIT